MQATKPYIFNNILFVPLAIIFFCMRYFLQKIPYEGANGLMIDFEFADSTQRISEVLGPLSLDSLHYLDRANHVDFVFIICYGSLLFWFFKLTKDFYKPKVGWWGQFLSLAIMIFDACENGAMLQITDQFRNAETGDLGIWPMLLQIFTWAKWLSIAIAFVMISYLIFKWTWWSKVFAILFFIPFVLGLIALLSDTVNVGIFSLSIFLGFGLIFIFQFIFKLKINDPA